MKESKICDILGQNFELNGSVNSNNAIAKCQTPKNMNTDNSLENKNIEKGIT